MGGTLEELIVEKTLRIPAPTGLEGDGDTAARQFDAVLMSAGFKMSRQLLAHLSSLSAGTVIDTALQVLPVVRRMVGDHVKHNTYFEDFPAGVPDTLDFWASLLAEALLDPVAANAVATTSPPGGLNLLALPGYGRYLHTYEEMLAAHDDLIRAAGDRVTVLHLGGPLEEEVHGLYLRLAGSSVPLGEEDLQLLADLAGLCVDRPQPETIQVRENRAVINQARLEVGGELLVDTVTDVLRLACALSGCDVTLREPTRFASLPISTATIMRGIVERDYLRVRYLVDLWAALGADVTVWDGGGVPDGLVTFVGLERPEGLAEGSSVYALDRLRDLIPQ